MRSLLVTFFITLVATLGVWHINRVGSLDARSQASVAAPWAVTVSSFSQSSLSEDQEVATVALNQMELSPDPLSDHTSTWAEPTRVSFRLEVTDTNEVTVRLPEALNNALDLSVKNIPSADPMSQAFDVELKLKAGVASTSIDWKSPVLHVYALDDTSTPEKLSVSLLRYAVFGRYNDLGSEVLVHQMPLDATGPDNTAAGSNGIWQ
jgi:hypothetical protein